MVIIVVTLLPIVRGVLIRLNLTRGEIKKTKNNGLLCSWLGNDDQMQFQGIIHHRSLPGFGG